MNPNVSIIIRAKNEEKYLGRVLEMLKQQTYQDFEVVLVDDHSTDKTLDIAESYGCKVVTIPEGKFTYPYACNFGAENSAGKYIVFLSGHSIPVTQDWLWDGISNFSDEKVAGIYSMVFALPDANRVERLLYNAFSGIRRKRFVVEKPRKVGMGVLGFTNAIIRRDLWEKYPIDEGFAGGGEDTAWAKYWVSQGFAIVHDPRFIVYHSHNLGLIDQTKQFANWVKVRKPTPFKAQKRNFEFYRILTKNNYRSFSYYFGKMKTVLATNLYDKKTAELDLLLITENDKRRDL